MYELRWALLLLGAVFLAGLALWEWRRPRHGSGKDPALHVPMPAATDFTRRVEPRMDDFETLDTDPDPRVEVPTIHAFEPVRVEVSSERAVDVPAAAMRETSPDVAIQWPPDHAGRVLSLRVVMTDGSPLPGRPLRAALEAAGLRHGPQQIFHQVATDGRVLASVANLVRPGRLDPHEMDAQSFRGLNLFSVLPGPLPDERMFEGLVSLARGLAARLGAAVQDEHGLSLDSERLTQLRRSLQGADEGGAAQ
jgi:FtsZ-interacting cell division protein ZipA